MGGSLNKVLLIGNVGRDPEIKATHDGREIATFSLATSDVWKDKVTMEKRETAEWHKIVIFAPLIVTFVKNYVHKGSKIYLEGTLKTRKWMDQTGAERYTTEVVLHPYTGVLTSLDSKGTSQNSGAKDGYQQYGSAAGVGNGGPSHTGMHVQHGDQMPANIMEDEIPF